MKSMNSTEIVGSRLQNGSSEQPDIAIVGELNPDLIVYGAPRELTSELRPPLVCNDQIVSRGQPPT
jgi:hypothetical protein